MFEVTNNSRGARVFNVSDPNDSAAGQSVTLAPGETRVFALAQRDSAVIKAWERAGEVTIKEAAPAKNTTTANAAANAPGKSDDDDDARVPRRIERK